MGVPGSLLLSVGSLKGAECVVHQHRDGHGAYASRDGGDVCGFG